MRQARALLAILVSAFFLFPLYLVIANAFKTEPEILRSPARPPIGPTLDGMSGVLDAGDVGGGLVNSLLITGSTIALIMLLSSMLAFALHMSNSWVSNTIGAVILFGLILPTPVILIPVFRVLKYFGLQNSFPGLILFLCAYYAPFAVLVYRGFMRSIPRDLVEAASMDGASLGFIYWSVILPLLRPATASVLVITGVWVWNEFLPPLVLLGPLQGNTVTVGLFRSVGQFDVNFGQLFSYMLFVSIPVLVFYLVLQRYFVRGLTAGATK